MPFFPNIFSTNMTQLSAQSWQLNAQALGSANSLWAWTIPNQAGPASSWSYQAKRSSEEQVQTMPRLCPFRIEAQSEKYSKTQIFAFTLTDT